MDLIQNLKLPGQPALVAQTSGLLYRRLAACTVLELRHSKIPHSPATRAARRCSRRISPLWRTITALLAALLAFVPFASVDASETSMPEYQVKALFLFNFAKYVEWPGTAFPSEASPLTIGILGNSNFGDLNKILKDKTIGGRKIVVRQLTNDQEILDSQILFISGSEQGHLSDILQLAKEHPILTVSDIAHFTESGGMIGFVKKDDRIHLEIDLAPAQRAQLQLSSKLLSVADSVRGKH